MIVAEKTLIALTMFMAILLSSVFVAIRNSEVQRIRAHDQWLYRQNEELKRFAEKNPEDEDLLVECSTSPQETE